MFPAEAWRMHRASADDRHLGEIGLHRPLNSDRKITVHFQEGVFSVLLLINNEH